MHVQACPNPAALPVAPNRAVQLWTASLDCPAWKGLLPLLSADEVDRLNRFSFERDARRFAVSHAVLRWLLGHLLNRPPEDVALRVEAHGKPVLKDGVRALHFSLSRSAERTLVGVAAQPLGVDIECLATPLDVEALAEPVFSSREREVFEQTRPETRREVFFRSWTRKEAVLKATGQGLSIPPAAVEVLLASGDGMARQAAVTCLGSRWQVDTLLPEPGYVGAVATAFSHEAPRALAEAGLQPRIATLCLEAILPSPPPGS
ncbi:4'-phosphopantetheinyl transferase superfamily protein [Belnapia sp. T18]|uniref:4'-phosphopantetheinyl transferase superfamily protein n=1 Tax=Belnapia arida TaxID=2804533 RepID=A0ABS1U0B4_9PROT|nr:4'-phosphopantetheinyl transferase superfamily protein [Belnapia arida]MBL6078119.1 4'-phosphopantetheinyl transferase superfamily protein [Belnapia arida]